MQLPEALLRSLEGVPGFDRERFIDAHNEGNTVTSVRLNPSKTIDAAKHFSVKKEVPWSTFGYYLSARPSFTFDPLFHAGCYYVQEASSMFLEQALMQTLDLQKPLRVLDLCGAPGGKSTHIQSLLSNDSLLVSNEVIKARTNVLAQNIIKWGCVNVVVTNSDPAQFSKLEGYFDAIVVDAPCSGSGLFRRDPSAIEEWSEDNVALCSQRQQRILAAALPSLKEGGVLIYSTCSYSTEEDEDIADWLVNEYDMINLPLQLKNEWGIVKTISPDHNAEGYRFYPDAVEGEGFFLCCFRKTRPTHEKKMKTAKPEFITKNEKQAVLPWVNEEGIELLKHVNRVLAFPVSLVTDLQLLQASVYINYAGTSVGEIMHNKLVPDHALALSPLLHPEITRTELDYPTAIKYLQRAEIMIETTKGWQVVTFKGHPLGWINALPNRINNYYPKGLRILKQDNDAGFEK